VDFWRCDLLAEGALAELGALRAFDAVVHLAGLLPTEAAARRDLFAVNVGGTSAVLKRLAGPACQVVFFSTGLVYGNQRGPFVEETPCQPLDAYGQSKLAAEALVLAWGRATGSPVTVLRPSVLYGPGAPAGMLLEALLAALARRAPFPMTGGEQVRDFLHVEDAAAAVVQVIEGRAGGTWNLASGDSRTVRDAVELVARVAGRPELVRVGALPYRGDEVFDYRLDPSALQRATGWRPLVPFSDGVTALWKARS
jgi:UDP-glucose 4-epimerase